MQKRLNIELPDYSDDQLNALLEQLNAMGCRVIDASLQDQFLKNEALTKTTLEYLPLIFYVIDAKGFFQLTVGAGLKNISLSPDKVVGQSVFELYKDSPEIINAINKALNGEVVYFESRVNDSYHFNVVMPHFGTDIIGVAMDVTKLKKSEIEALAARDKAEESDRIKTAFLHNISHEIRTPMNAIMGFSELLPSFFDKKDKLTEFCSIIQQRSSDLLTIINDLLDVAKIESGTITINPETCYLGWLCEELQPMFLEYRKKLGKEHLDFKVNTSDRVKSLLLFMDVVKVKQILINLITNAFKYTDEGSVELSCTQENPRELLFCVSDTGTGIPEDKIQYVFERFAQLDDPNRAFTKGTGLGLSIVKGLSDVLGGRVWLESTLGMGSKFYFALPIDRVDNQVE